MRRFLLYIVVPLLLLVAWGALRFRIVYFRTVQLADAHSRHMVAHAGWSYPAHVYTGAASMTEPYDRLLLQAKGRGYQEICPPVEPGEYCARTGEFYLRGGIFPEGKQPPTRFSVEPIRKSKIKADLKASGAKDSRKEREKKKLSETLNVVYSDPSSTPQGWTRPVAFEPVYMGMLLGQATEWREHLPLNEAPEILIHAVMAAEDASFRGHRGVDFVALGRAMARNTEAQTYAQGGSTLTMQVVRGFSQNKSRTVSRKLNEVLAALALDHYMGKDAILSAYLDIPYLGQRGSISVCGFRTAAWHYFGVPIEKISLAQAALLAGILPAPGKFSPTVSLEVAKERRDRVLRAMQQNGWASQADVDAALASPIEVNEGVFPEANFPAYLSAVHQWLEKNLPQDVVYGAGLQVFTGLDVAAQAATDRVIPERLKLLTTMLPRYKEPLQCAVVGVEPKTGRITLIYGGKKTTATGFNRATQARRQGGSAYKPVVYAAAFSLRDDSGNPRYTPASAFINTVRDFKSPSGTWRPKNICGEYTPTACLAYSLVWSQNIATASLLEEIGLDTFLDHAQDFGFDTSGYPRELGLALGQGEVTVEEMARFTAMLANGGLKVEFNPVETALDAAGQVRFQRQEPGPRVMRDEDAALLRALMEQVVRTGTGGRVRGAGGNPGFQGEIFGKTGTTDDERDLWFVGGTADLAGALWLGYDDPERIGATGADLTAPMFGWWQRAAHEGLPNKSFGKRDDIEVRTVCNVSGKRPGANCLGTQAPFIKGTAPKVACNLVHEDAHVLGPDGQPLEGEDIYVPATPSGRRLGPVSEPAKARSTRRTIWDKKEDEEDKDKKTPTSEASERGEMSKPKEEKKKPASSSL